jgi:copper chaperone
MEKITLGIDGMSCGHCVAAVKKELAGVQGVAVDDVAIGSATVRYDPAVTSLDRISEAIGDAGYVVSSTQTG